MQKAPDNLEGSARRRRRERHLMLQQDTSILRRIQMHRSKEPKMTIEKMKKELQREDGIDISRSRLHRLVQAKMPSERRDAALEKIVDDRVRLIIGEVIRELRVGQSLVVHISQFLSYIRKYPQSSSGERSALEDLADRVSSESIRSRCLAIRAYRLGSYVCFSRRYATREEMFDIIHSSIKMRHVGHIRPYNEIVSREVV